MAASVPRPDALGRAPHEARDRVPPRRITEEAYRANVARLGVTPPPPPIETPWAADDRRTTLDNAYREARISRETYEANLAKLTPARPAPAQDKTAAPRAAFREGKIDRRLFAGNLGQAFIAGRIEADLLEKNLRRLRQE